MTLERPMFPPRAEMVPHRNHFAALETVPPKNRFAAPSKPATIGRRGLLGAFLALVPAAAAAGAAASLPVPASPRENSRLLWLGRQLDQAEAAFAAALVRKARCREKAEMAYPEPPTEITWLPGEHPPAWCGIREEADVDGRVVYWRGNPSHFRSTARKIACAHQLADFLEYADSRTKQTRAARHLLKLAQRYDQDVEEVIAGTGYRAACDDVDQLGRRIDRIATLIYKCECRTFEGVAIKALALMVATKVDAVDDYIAHRSKVLYAEQLAAGVLKLRDAGSMVGGRAA